MGAVTTEGISILINEWGGGVGFALPTEGISILLKSQKDMGASANRRFFIQY